MKKKSIALYCLVTIVIGLSMKTFAQQDTDCKRLIYPYAFAPSEGWVNKTEAAYRQEICLNGYWDFMPMNLPAGYRQGQGAAPRLAFPAEHDKWSSTRIKIPSPWNINSFANNDLEGPDHRNYPSYPKEWDQVKMAWMKKKVVIPSDWNNQTIQLYFEAVAGYAEVYINREKVGENFDLFLPFSFDITDKVVPGKEAEILVGVRSQKLFEDNSTIGRRIVPAGSMWGYHINGIWQDVYLLALPKIHIDDIYVKPLVSENKLELDVTIRNCTGHPAEIWLQGNVHEWINQAGTDVHTAPVPSWHLGEKTLQIASYKTIVAADTIQKVTLQTPVKEGDLNYWTPEHPNLYALLLSAKSKGQTIDLKYSRFGWREWTLKGTTQYLNGVPYPLRGDSWHFMGIPQMTRRYAWAWYTAVKGMNGNAVRPHAQVYPRFYLDMADEMGICVLNETANWASDGGPKLDSDAFWQASKEHLRRFVLRDRNHASVFGWSISNENKPVILHVYNKPELMPLQMKAWEEWRDIVRQNDSTRPWISADGEDDGDGILPVTVGHYGDMNSMKHWIETGKPWGIGEHSMAYYGTPEQVSRYNGERAYESQEGRMEGVANECYHLIANQRRMGASYSSVFNMAWYALKPLPLGKRDIRTAPTPDDGIFFTDYKEGIPGVQPERMGPYCTTFNPGYDAGWPLYEEWPMYEAMRAANTPSAPAWCRYAAPDKGHEVADATYVSCRPYKEVVFVGDSTSGVRRLMEEQGVHLHSKAGNSHPLLFVVDGSQTLDEKSIQTMNKHIAAGADVWIWDPTPSALESLNKILPLPIELDELRRSSFLPVQKSWLRGLHNSDFYFCELQQADASHYSLKGALTEESDILLNACRTDWRRWNKRAEETKTAGTLRSENECTASTAVFIRYQSRQSTFYISTLREFAHSDRGFRTLGKIIAHAGIPHEELPTDVDDLFFVRDGQLKLPISASRKMVRQDEGQWTLVFYVYSPRPLDNLLIEPDMPKLSLHVRALQRTLTVNGKAYARQSYNGTHETIYKELPLEQGWNRLALTISDKDHSSPDFDAYFTCENQKLFLSQLQAAFNHPKTKE